jgi:hypothetical protein
MLGTRDRLPVAPDCMGNQISQNFAGTITGRDRGRRILAPGGGFARAGDMLMAVDSVVIKARYTALAPDRFAKFWRD